MAPFFDPRPCCDRCHAPCLMIPPWPGPLGRRERGRCRAARVRPCAGGARPRHVLRCVVIHYVRQRAAGHTRLQYATRSHTATYTASTPLASIHARPRPSMKATPLACFFWPPRFVARAVEAGQPLLRASPGHRTDWQPRKKQAGDNAAFCFARKGYHFPVRIYADASEQLGGFGSTVVLAIARVGSG